jgi:hypothetical protein
MGIIFNASLQNETRVLSLQVAQATQQSNIAKTRLYYLAALIVIGILAFVFYRYAIIQKLQKSRFRNKVSKDLHDDVGSSLSSLNVYSTVAAKVLENNPGNDYANLVPKIYGNIALIFTNPKSKSQSVAGEGIRIGLYRGRSLVSRAIRFRTWSDYAHASLILPDDWIIEALPFHGVAHHHSIHDLHTPETPIEIWQPNWTALVSAWAPSQTERTEP